MKYPQIVVDDCGQHFHIFFGWNYIKAARDPNLIRFGDIDLNTVQNYTNLEWGGTETTKLDAALIHYTI